MWNYVSYPYGAHEIEESFWLARRHRRLSHFIYWSHCEKIIRGKSSEVTYLWNISLHTLKPDYQPPTKAAPSTRADGRSLQPLRLRAPVSL